MSEQPNQLWQELMRLRDQERERIERAVVVAKGNEAPREITPEGIFAWYAHPLLDRSVLKSYLVWVQEIPVGSRSGRVKHPGARVHYVWQGRGHTVIDGVGHEWEKGDIVVLPTKAHGIEFQHFNTGDVPVKLVCYELNLVGTFGVDRGAGYDVIEPAPEYRARQ